MITSYKVPKGKLKEIKNWCNSNQIHKFEVVGTDWSQFIFFESHDDAMLVKITFGEEKWDEEK